MQAILATRQNARVAARPLRWADLRMQGSFCLVGKALLKLASIGACKYWAARPHWGQMGGFKSWGGNLPAPSVDLRS
jgi:hypothetical protein